MKELQAVAQFEEGLQEKDPYLKEVSMKVIPLLFVDILLMLVILLCLILRGEVMVIVSICS